MEDRNCCVHQHSFSILHAAPLHTDILGYRRPRGGHDLARLAGAGGGGPVMVAVPDQPDRAESSTLRTSNLPLPATIMATPQPQQVNIADLSLAQLGEVRKQLDDVRSSPVNRAAIRR